MRTKRSKRKTKPAAPEGRKLRARIQELEETLLAINSGKVDALVVKGSTGNQVFTLQGAEHPYRVLVESMNEGAATLGKDGTILYANASFAALLEVPLENVIGTALQRFFSPNEQDSLRELIGNALHGESRGELSLTSFPGQRRLVRFSLSPVHTPNLRTICVVATDLTELSGAHDALRELSGRLLRLQDEERRRISRDLHDVTGQKLALLSMDLSSLVRMKAISDTGEAQRYLSEAVGLAAEINQEIRTLSYVLHPPLLDELGLSSAVHWFAQGFEKRTGIAVSLDIPDDFVRLAPDAEVALFRIVQESLTNVHRYSGSATAFVRARADSRTVRLEIGDHGKGMREHSKMPNLASDALGVGIQGMKERLRQLSGQLQIVSQAGNGTLVTAILPIRWQRTEELDDDQNVAGEEGRAPLAEEHAEPNGHPSRILIADDHDVLRRGVRTLLEGEPGLDVCGEAVNGTEAIEKTLMLAPDLVILDINMPILNGLEVVRQIARHRPKTKILAFSVHESQQIVEEVIAAGAHGYVSKATAGQHLVNEINLLLGKHMPSLESVAGIAQSLPSSSRAKD